MKKKQLIIFTHGGGRFANQLINQANFLAFNEEYPDAYEIINLAFVPYSKYFKSFYQDNRINNKILTSPSGKFVIKLFSTGRNNKISFLNQIIRLLHFVVGIFPGNQSLKIGEVPNYIKYLFGVRYDRVDLEQCTISELRRKEGITIVAGWPIRCWNYFEKHQSIIRQRMSFRDELCKMLNTKINSIRAKHDTIVGVFIRQGDYRIWQNGSYYFSIEQYMDWVNQTRESIDANDAGFIIFSENKLSIDPQNGESLYQLFNNSGEMLSFAEAMAGLSMCDYILTPPSTFGIWAAFLGNVPIIPVYEKGQRISTSQFLQRNLFDAIVHPHMSVALQ